MPFKIKLPSITGPMSFNSRLVRVYYQLSATLCILGQHRRKYVRTSQEVSVIPVYASETTLLLLPHPIIASEDIRLKHRRGSTMARLAAAMHRQTWVSGCGLFVDVSIMNTSERSVKKLDIVLVQNVLLYKYAAATMDGIPAQDRLSEHNECQVLCRLTKRHPLSSWHSTEEEYHSYEIEVPVSVITSEVGRYFEIRHFLIVSIKLSQNEKLAVQLPIRLVHIDSLDHAGSVQPSGKKHGTRQRLQDALERTEQQRIVDEIGQLVEKSPRRYNVRRTLKTFDESPIQLQCMPSSMQATPEKLPLRQLSASSQKAAYRNDDEARRQDAWLQGCAKLPNVGTVIRHNVVPCRLDLTKDAQQVFEHRSAAENERPATSHSSRQPERRFVFKAPRRQSSMSALKARGRALLDSIGIARKDSSSFRQQY